MRAALLEEYGEPLSIEEVEAPDPEPDGVVVRTEACGICRSDWHGWRGDWGWLGVKPPKGQILGHEPAGTVIAAGDEVERVSEGDQVAIPVNISDGSCDYCRSGSSNVCENIIPLGLTERAPGAFAEELHVPVADQNAVPLPDGVDPVDMAGLGCRFITSFHGLAHRADIAPGDWVAVHGCGGIGLSAVHIADALGGNVVGIDLMDEKLDKARELGAVETVNAAETDNVSKAVKAITDGGADVSVDALGIAETCRNSVLSLDRLGTHVQIGLTTSDEAGTVDIPTDFIVMQEIDFVGSVGMPPTRFGEIFRMVERGKLDPAAVISETVTLDDVSAKLDEMTDYGTVGMPVITEFS